MANARILQACDAAVELIVAAWDASAIPMGDDDAVTRAYAPVISLTPDVQPQIAGRQVYVFPRPGETTQFTRADLLDVHRIRVLVAEQYQPEEGDPVEPSLAWTDERVNFVYMIRDLLKNPSLNLIGEMTPAVEESATVDTLYDDNALQRDMLFWSVMTFPFQEDTDLSGGVSL